MTKFDNKTVNVTNYFELICGGHDGMCVRKKVKMELNEVKLKTKVCCGKKQMRRPYAQLTHVSISSCCKLCTTITTDLAPPIYEEVTDSEGNPTGEMRQVGGGISSGWGCDNEKTYVGVDLCLITQNDLLIASNF